MGSTYQSETYEANIKNASVRISNSEWINNYPGGIKLKTGDTVRLLGSFVHEGSSGDEIQIADDIKTNVSFSPFIKALTYGTADKATNLMDVGNIGDLAYSTDAFGIEPPLFYQTDISSATTNEPNLWGPTTGQQDNAINSDPLVTGYPITSVCNYKIPDDPPGVSSGAAEWFFPGKTQNEYARTWGTNIQTDTLEEDSHGNSGYKAFANSRVDNEMYIGQLVKKFILPVTDRINTHNQAAGSAAPNPGAGVIRNVELLVDNPPDDGAGMFAGIPKAGMAFATVNISGSSGWYSTDGGAFYEGTYGSPPDVANREGSWDYNGQPNCKSGVESVVGTILASRPILQNIMGKATRCYEIYVTDWVNPGAVQAAPLEYTFPANTLKSATYQTFDPTTPINEKAPFNTAPIKAYKLPHGAAFRPNGYNVNPSFNNINGTTNTGFNNDGATGSPYTSTTLPQFGSGSAPNQHALTPLGSWKDTSTPATLAWYSQVNTGSEITNTSAFGLLYGQPTGLSFPWNGSHTGVLRYGSQARPVAAGVVDHMFLRSNCLLNWYIPTNADYIMADILCNNIKVTGDANDPVTHPRTITSEGLDELPVCLGAYIITTPAAMKKIINGEIDTNIGNNFNAQTPGDNARIWFEWSFQSSVSQYKTRHYTGNSWNNSGLGVPIGQDWATGTGASTVPPAAPEKRHNWDLCGQPLNMNWRGSVYGTATGATDLNGGRTIEWIDNTRDYRAGTGGVDVSNTTAPDQIGDYGPRYWQSANGKTPAAPYNVWSGYPFSWGGYQNCINSIYFQDKQSGDVDLGITTKITHGITTSATTINGTTVQINITDAPRTGVKSYLNIQYADFGLNFQCATARHMVEIIGITPNGGNLYTLTVDPLTPFFIVTPINTICHIYQNTEGTNENVAFGCSAGINATPWAGDMLMIRESMAELTIKAGYYTEVQLGKAIDEQLHSNPRKYAQEFGTKQPDNTYKVPTTVGYQNFASTSEPAIVNGNYLHSYLPDVNYGFTPVTSANYVELGKDASTRDLTDVLFTYDVGRDGFGVPKYYWPDEYLTSPELQYNGTTVRKVTDSNGAYISTAGKHLRLYSIPHVSTSPLFNQQLVLMRLRGGAYNLTDYNSTATPPRWELETSRQSGVMESLRDFQGTSTGTIADYQPPRMNPWATVSVYNYKTRLVRNLFSMGGSAKIFVGANNLTFEWNDEANRFSWNNLYTALRPHNSENATTSDFGIDDAIPSAIISARGNGDKIGSLTGIYINNFNADSFNKANWGISIFDNWAYTTDTDEETQLEGAALMNTLGYPSTQLLPKINNFKSTDPIFIYISDEVQSGTATRVGPLIDTSINGSNPFAAYCSVMVPVQQFYVEVLTDDFFGLNIPEKGTDPYYFVGSDFPTTRFYGNDQGQRLPVVGICARNFHSFNFAFDLGSSSITYTVEEDITITSIRTAIYNSSLQPANNLSRFSSVIYLVTKANFINNITDPKELQQVAQLTDLPYQMPPPNGFYNQAQAEYRTQPPILPPNFFQGTGILIDDDDDDDEYSSE